MSIVRNFNNMFRSPSSADDDVTYDRYKIEMQNYIYDIGSKDYIGKTIAEVAVFQDLHAPFAVDGFRGVNTKADPYMSDKTQTLLYVLHKLKVRPPL